MINIERLKSLLKCTGCGNESMTWHPFQNDGEGVNGIFKCAQCSRYYPMENSALDCLPPDLISVPGRQAFERKFENQLPGDFVPFGGGAQKERDKTCGFAFEDHSPSEYEEKVVESDFWKQVNRVILKKWIRELKGQEGPVIDIGCGTGRVSHALAQEGFQVIGLDVTVEMVQMAREKARKAGLEERVCYVAGDIWNLPFREGVFSGLVFFGVLHHLNEPYAALTHLTKLLGEKAVICGSENNKSIFRNLFDALMKFFPVWEEDHALEHATISESSLTEVLKQSGFIVKAESTCFIPPHLYYLGTAIGDSFYRAMDFLLGRLPFLSQQGGLIYFQAYRGK